MRSAGACRAPAISNAAATSVWLSTISASTSNLRQTLAQVLRRRLSLGTNCMASWSKCPSVQTIDWRPAVKIVPS